MRTLSKIPNSFLKKAVIHVPKKNKRSTMPHFDRRRTTSKLQAKHESKGDQHIAPNQVYQKIKVETAEI
jgi:hypothetical protein